MLVELQRRNKVGGIVDRRFGENDPTMTPEERALERFVRASQGAKKRSMFDLEDEGEEEGLTHLGQPLSLSDNKAVDDFDEDGLDQSDDDTDAEGERRGKKRLKITEEYAPLENGDEDIPQRPKTKAEAMKEVIAKSKLHKYERQQAKEDDDDLRMELDQELQGISALMRGLNPPRSEPKESNGTAVEEPQINPDRAALLQGKDRDEADREYERRLREMVFDKRSQPTQRTKTEEEQAEENANRLRELEEKRLRRMRGEESESEAEGNGVDGLSGDQDFENFEDETEDATGLGKHIPVQSQSQKRELDVEDEDDFILDDDLIAYGSDVDLVLSDDENSGPEAQEDGEHEIDDEEREFVHGLHPKLDVGKAKVESTSSALAYTYPCPQSHDELLEVVKGTSLNDFPTIIQRIRALYHPKLDSENKTKLGSFAAVLVDHIYYLTNQPDHPSFAVLEATIRHIHSLAKSFPNEVANAFQAHLKTIHAERSTTLNAGDLIIFTAIGSIYSTSDNFHAIVTPAMMSMARFLSQKIPQTLADLAKSGYLCTLLIQYQSLSKRYIPEVVNSALQALTSLAPLKSKQRFGDNPYHELPDTIRIKSKKKDKTPADARQITFWDIEHVSDNTKADEILKLGLLNLNISLVSKLLPLWSTKSAFIEIFTPFSLALTHLSSSYTLPPSTSTLLTSTISALYSSLQSAHESRKPLALHNHRPLAIRTFIPKFEDNFAPWKHYDHDRERADSTRLRKEFKRERKGALRELRKDSRFIARTQLKDKKERDEAYEKKMRRLEAEIRGGD